MALLRRLIPIAGAVAAGAVGVRLARAARGVPSALGASGRAIRSATQRSSAFADGTIHNRMPSSMLSAGSTPELLKAFRRRPKGTGRPHGDVPLAVPAFAAHASALAATWLGHASALIEVDGAYVLADPIVDERVSPSPTLGPARLHPAPLVLEALPELTAVIISHDHYDHLEAGTVRRLVELQSMPFVVPVGVGAHLRRWGVPDARVVELDWDESVEINGIRLVCTEARHFSGRLFTRNNTLWSSWAILGPRNRVFFGGDTGYTRAFEGIGARYGMFQLTLLPIGAYSDFWPDIHMNPEEAVQAHQDVNGRFLVPIHWCTFRLAPHPWAEPIERLLVAADAADVQVAVPKPGGRVDPAAPAALEQWWRLANRSG
jgi:L-ascorbate metabolism protein UlaG (beta-lactamase superfamily)